LIYINKKARINYSSGELLVANVASNAVSETFFSSYLMNFYVWKIHLVDDLLNDIDLSDFTYLSGGLGSLSNGGFYVYGESWQDTGLWDEANLVEGKIVFKTRLNTSELRDAIIGKIKQDLYLQVLGSTDGVTYTTICTLKLEVKNVMENKEEFSSSSSSSSSTEISETSSTEQSETSSSSSSESSLSSESWDDPVYVTNGETGKWSGNGASFSGSYPFYYNDVTNSIAWYLYTINFGEDYSGWVLTGEDYSMGGDRPYARYIKSSNPSEKLGNYIPSTISYWPGDQAVGSPNIHK
jgi:hypothetical protein